MKNKLMLLAVIALAACSSGPKQSKAKYQTLFDFSTVSSYSLYDRNQPFSELQSLSHVMRNDIELAIERGMEKQGYHYISADSADVIVTYYLLDHNIRDFKRYNTSINYCSYCLTHSTTGKRGDRLKNGPGSLILDVIERKTKRSVWRSTYPLKIDVKDNSSEVQTKVHQAVSVMLNELSKVRNAA